MLLFVTLNGPISFLDDYLITSWWMASGYSSQMTLTAELLYDGLLLVLACGVAVFLLVLLLDRQTRGRYAPVLLILALPLFLTYKSAIVRCDDPHRNAGVVTFLALLCLLLTADMGRRGTALFRLLISALTLGSVITVFSGTRDSSGFSSTMLFDGPGHLAELFVWSRVRAPLRTAFEAFREDEALPANDLAEIAAASVDVYPWDISLIAANQLRWSPRYVLQSYQAFHPALDVIGAEHYNRPQAPRFILYRHQSIDDQHPCLVDPRTWLAIYRWYDLRTVFPREKDLLLLERRSAPRFGQPLLIGSQTIEIGQEILLPKLDEEQLILLEADLDLTLLGKLKEQLYKIEPPSVRINYKDGQIEEHRLVWKNLATRPGALVSQLPRNPNAARIMFQGQRVDQVHAVTLLATESSFNKKIRIQLYAIGSGTSAKKHRPDVNP